MQTLRTTVLTLVFLALTALTASAQIQAGASLAFDHGPDDAADTSKYQLCVDGVTDATCKDISVLRVGTTNSYTFTLPSFVGRGNRALQVRAVGFDDLGASVGSNTLNVRVVGKPGPPTNLRTSAP